MCVCVVVWGVCVCVRGRGNIDTTLRSKCFSVLSSQRCLLSGLKDTEKIR